MSRDPASILIAALPGLMIIGCASNADRYQFNPQDYPKVARGQAVDQSHGQPVADPYRWLEDEESPETQAFIAAENELTEKTLSAFPKASAAIAGEIKQLYGVDSISNLYPRGERYFLLKRNGLENHPRLYVREDSYSAPDRLVIDPNTFSKDGTVAMDWWYPSPDGRYVAYGTSPHGSEKSTLHVREVQTGKDLPDTIPFTQYCSVAWLPDGSGFHYNRCPDPTTVPEGEENFHMRVYLHKLGTDWKSDRNEWGGGRPKDEEPRPYTSGDHRYVLLNFYRDPSENDLFFKPISDPGDFRPVAAGMGAITSGDAIDDTLIVRTNINAPRFRICRTSVNAPTPEHWTEIIPQQKGVITDFDIAGGTLLVHVSEDVRSRLMVYDLNGNLSHEVPLPGIGSVNSISAEPGKPDVFFTFDSWVVPTATYHYDLQSRKLAKLHQKDCPVDLDRFDTRQIWFTSKDGTRVPMFVVCRRDIELDGQNPTLLYGYGGFNVSFFPYYRPRIIPFLKRGGVWVLANIRGGGEFGAAWHEAGRREFKQNVFDDFYAAGEKLIELGYTNPSMLACKGGSNGGLLIGAAVTQRPDLFQAALSQVPLMDMLRFHLWGMGAQWVHEYGDPADPEEFRWLKAYSPYHNVRQGEDYPATLIVTAEADNRVDTAHAYKMTAALQNATAGLRPILLRVESKAGHGAGKPLNKRIADQTQDWVFLMWQLGMLENGG